MFANQGRDRTQVRNVRQHGRLQLPNPLRRPDTPIDELQRDVLGKAPRVVHQRVQPFDVRLGAVFEVMPDERSRQAQTKALSHGMIRSNESVSRAYSGTRWDVWGRRDGPYAGHLHVVDRVPAPGPIHAQNETAACVSVFLGRQL